MWLPRQPNGGSLQKCATFDAENGLYYDDSCSYKSCFICSWKYQPVFKLRGSVVTAVEFHSEASEIQYIFAPQSIPSKDF